MRYLISFSVLVFTFLALTSCSDGDFLTRPPLDEMSDQTYWTSESNVQSFAWGFYPAYFDGYGSGYTWGDYFAGQTLNDDFAPSNQPDFLQNVPTSGGGWGFGWVRKANLMIDRVKGMDMDPEAKKHWVGVGRFFRALEYNDLVKRFGDIQWYGEVLQEDEEDKLYKPRDPRGMVMDSVLADFQYAVDNVRQEDGTPGLTVNRDVVLAFMSRVFLYHGTYFKHHNIDQQKAQTYLQAARDAANQLIESGRYSLADDYRGLFNSMDLSGNPEMIMYRKYEEGALTHSLHTYSDYEPQSGASKDAIDSYRMDNGLPIRQSTSGYQGDEGMDNVMADRDPRMTETFVDSLRLTGETSNYSTSGYAQLKFMNEEISGQLSGTQNNNPTDAPVIRYGEVLLNYAEASYELSDQISQADLDKSINELRDRAGMPHLQVSGQQAAVNGNTIDDPEQDGDVSGILWEIRNERRVELMMEGFRLDDLKRWEKLEKTDTPANEDINRGAWVDLSDYEDNEGNVTIDVQVDGNGEGFIIPATEPQSQRSYPGDRVYLYPLPLDQIQLYEDNGATLEQNPGW